MAVLCFCCANVLDCCTLILYVFIQQELRKVSDRIQGSIADREKLIQSLPQVSQAHKVIITGNLASVSQ